MLAKDRGVLSGSQHFRIEASETARRLLYYITDCGQYFCEFGYYIQRDDYGRFLMLYVTRGKLNVKVEGQEYVVHEGEAAFFDCHVNHTYYADGFTAFHWIHFNGSNSAGIYRTFKEKQKSIVLAGEKAAKVYEVLQNVISRYVNDTNIVESTISTELYQCLMLFLFADEELMQEALSPVEQACKYIKDHYHENLSVKEIGDSVGLSPSHFSRLFKKETGVSPYEYLITERMNQAKHLLRTTSLSVKQIGYAIGYQGESNFTNTFTERIGLSPLNYRNYKW